MRPSTEERLLTPKEFGHLVSYEPDYVRRLCKAGRINYVKHSNGRIRIPGTELSKFRIPLTVKDFPPPTSDEDIKTRAVAIAESM